MNILLEVNRQQLLAKSKKSDRYKDTSKGKNRYERRTKSRIATTVAEYNQLDMNTFWKKDILTVGIRVQGETNKYIVKITFNDVLREIQRQIKSNNNRLEFRIILQSLIRIFNAGDVYVSCSCPDWKYRQAYFATKGGYSSGQPETRASNITNPNDTKGAGCKHVNLVIANLDWLMKVASVINNYIKYCEEHMERNYADYIFPKLYGIPYNKAVQLSLFDTDDLASDEDTLNISNRLGRDRGKFRKDRIVNNQQKFKKKEKPLENPLGLKFSKNDEDIVDDDTNISISDVKKDDEEQREI